VKLWTKQPLAGGPVENTLSSPAGAHSATSLQEPKHGVIPVLHTPYDYDKGIS
jgi:hypothetical protein